MTILSLQCGNHFYRDTKCKRKRKLPRVVHGLLSQTHIHNGVGMWF
jgi:hypothetical protein